MLKGLAAFGIAIFVAGMIIYPRPTLFITVLLYVFLFVNKYEPEDEEDTTT